MLLLVACGDTQTADTPTPEAKVVAKMGVEPSPTREPPRSEPTKSPAPEPFPTEARPTATAITKATEVAPTEVLSTPTLVQGVPLTSASAITSPPPSMEGINTHTEMYGTGADPNIITLGPKLGGHPGWEPYPSKTSMEFELNHGIPVLAPIDMVLVGFNNGSAEYRIRPDGQKDAPYNDLLLYFKSVSPDWPGMSIGSYHLVSSPLLPGHNQDPGCSEIEEWGSRMQAQGHMFFPDGDRIMDPTGDALSCDALIGHTVKRGELIGFAGSVGSHSMAPFRFKVSHSSENPTVKKGNRYLHWVQPGSFFYWKCYSPGTNFPSGVLAYPFECGGYQLPAEQHDVSFKYSSKNATATLTPVPSADTPTPEAKVETKPSSTSVISWDQGKDYIGTNTTLCGPVVGTNTDRGSQGKSTNATLYIGKPFSDPDRFVVKISGRIRTEFANKSPENYYLSKDICITGLIKRIKDPQSPEIPGIIVENSTQIELSGKDAPTMTLWTKDYSFSRTPIESSDYIKGVNAEQWKTIGEIGDSANCERRVEEITNIANANTISEELHKKDTEAIYESVKRNEFTVLTSGTYELHRTLSIGDGHKLIGQGEIILLANNIDIGIKLDSGSISGLRIMNAGNEGVM